MRQSAYMAGPSAAAEMRPRTMRAEASTPRSRRRGSKDGGRPGRGGGLESLVLGQPARFMRPRIILIVVVALLTCFGFLMIYSASSITALTSAATHNDPAFYLKRQLLFAAVGTGFAILIAKVDYHVWAQKLIGPILFGTVGLLAVVFIPGAGHDAYGASRWIAIGGFTLQPSEFAKLTVILTAANLCSRYFEEHSIDASRFAKELLVYVCLPLVLILAQPDKGSTIIIASTLLVMAYLAGMEKRWVLGVVAFGIVGALVLSLRDEYSRQRMITVLDPWKDPSGAGYQLIQGFYAFGSGGVLGVGIGASRQKYGFLPMAYNDFIFAVIGEECGLVGTLGVLAGFLAFAWAGYQIARYAPDLCGRLIASGCTSLIIIQLLVNISGVLGIIPLSGKPIPFISYGGSTIMSCLMIAGMIVSVSRGSSLPETEYDRSRREWRMTEGDDASDRPRGIDGHCRDQGSFVGTPTLRSARKTDGRTPRSLGGPATPDAGFQEGGGRGGLRVVDGGAGRRGSAGGSSGEGRRSGGVTRIDLGPSAADRLRGRGSGSRRDRTRERGDRRGR